MASPTWDGVGWDGNEDLTMVGMDGEDERDIEMMQEMR